VDQVQLAEELHFVLYMYGAGPKWENTLDFIIGYILIVRVTCILLIIPMPMLTLEITALWCHLMVLLTMIETPQFSITFPQT